jgi:hypothetical protein
MIHTNLDLRDSVNNTWNGVYYNRVNPQSINDMIGNSLNKMKIYSSTDIFEGGQFSAFPNQTLYIVSPQLGSFRSLGPLGERDILKKHVVVANPNEISIDTYLNAEDYTDISRQSFRNLTFRLTDAYGNTINLHGQNWSFTLVLKPIMC